jgi:hypothetical protein
MSRGRSRRAAMKASVVVVMMVWGVACESIPQYSGSMEWSQWEVTVCNISAAYATDQLSLLIATDGTLRDENENDSQKHNRCDPFSIGPIHGTISWARARVSASLADTQQLRSIAAPRV